MHEMSIVAGVLKIVEDQARAAGATAINSIELEIGKLAGIEIDSLKFCYEIARKKSMAQNAELIVRSVPGRGHCSQCKKDVPVGFQMAVCPECEQAVVEIFQGRELRVLSINVD
jgi:hydrogenase nickel incorporation protein HypA/HybF